MKKRVFNNEKKYSGLIPVILFMFIVPLIVRMKIVEIPFNEFVWREDITNFADIFTYYKGIFIIVSSFLAIIFLFKIHLVDGKKIKIDKYKKIIFVSIIFIIITTFLSQYKHTAIWGYINRAEGAIVLVSYLIMVYYISEFVRTKKQFKFLLYSFLILGLVLGTIGFFQLKGKDIFAMSFFQKLYLMKGYASDDVSIKIRERVYMTLFNPNYVGSFITLVYGIALNMLILRKNKIEKLLWLVLIVLLGINLFGSYSEAGLVGIIFVTLAVIVINYKLIIRYKKQAIITTLVLILIFSYGYNKYEDNIFIKSVKTTINTISREIETPLKSITTRINLMKINYNGEELLFAANADNPHENFNLFDSNKTGIEFTYNKNEKFYYTENTRYNNIRIYLWELDNSKGYRFLIDKRRYEFIMYKNHLLYVNRIGKTVSLEPVDYVKAFEGYEHLGSGRFYIWSRSIPLLKKTWLIGFGPDHFVYNFPQTDYVGKNMKNMSMVNTVVDKPHNMYLQYAINIGVIPLLLLLAFWGMLLFELFKIVQKEELDDIYLTVAAAAFSSIIGFMAVGMFNDSTVNVSSVFWGIVGLGLAVVNYNRYDHVRFKEEN